MSHYQKHVFLCINQKEPGKICCANEGGEPFFEYLKDQLKAQDLHGAGKIRVSKSGCLGRCKLGPCMVIYPEGVWYKYHSFADLDTIIDKHFLHGQLVHELLIDAF